MNRIKILRREYGDKQIELAKYLDVAPPRLSNWENDRHAPPKEYIFKIADRYGVSTDYLMGYSESREFAEPDHIRLLREYLMTKFDYIFSEDKLKALDRAYTDLAQAYIGKR